jgi:hypothetical protein
VRYWLRVAGTNENPVENDWEAQAQRWRQQYGEVSMFAQRPRINPGDRLVMYAAGSPKLFGAGRINAVVEVTGEPRQSKHARWPWQVPQKMVVAGPLLESCPTLSDIDVDPKSVRRHSHIRLTQEQGMRAEELLGAGGVASERETR